MSEEKGAPDNVFEVFGYYKEYLVDTKLIGTRHCERPKDDVFGYESTQFHIAEKDIIFKPGKKIKSGQKYYTRTYPLCGKRKKINN